MGLGTGATAAIVGGIGAAGSVASGLIGSSAAGHAADTQAAAANNAANLERQSAVDALNFNKLQYGNSLNLLSPYYNTGVAANSRLAYLMGLSPNQGLPPGVVNPNAASSTAPGGVGSLSLLNQLRNGVGIDGFNPGASDPTLGTNGVGSGPRFQPFSAEGGQVPVVNPGTGAVDTLRTPGAGANFNPFSATSGQVPITSSPANPAQGALNPNDPGTSGTPGQVLLRNPDAGNFAPGATPGTVTATTNQGGTGQVPRIDGGGQPGVNPPSSGPGSFGSLAQGWNQTFSSPTDVTEQNDPGYQFRLQQGTQALQNSAAARGGLLSGGTAKALADYNQNAASGEYQNVYNRALQNYNTNYNTFTNDQTNQFNRLMALQSGGQTSANNLSASGITAANNAANIGLTSAGQIGQQYNNAGAATASGYIGGANAINGAIGSGTNTLSTLGLLQLLKQGGAGAGGQGV